MRISVSYPRGLGFGFGYLSHIQIRADLDVDTKVVSADEDMSQSIWKVVKPAYHEVLLKIIYDGSARPDAQIDPINSDPPPSFTVASLQNTPPTSVK